MMKKTIKLSFSEFTLDNAPDNKFVWSGNFIINNNFFKGQIPLYIITDEQKVEEKTVHAIEEMVMHIDDYLQRSIAFLKKTLTKETIKYKIKPDEIQYLSSDLKDFPIENPEITFWQDSDQEWAIRFAEGKFYIFDPYGIAVYFKGKEIIRIENLDDADSI